MENQQVPPIITNIPPITPVSPSDQGPEDLRFLYGQLRAEILQNDSLGAQILAFTTVLVSAAMGVAFQVTSHDLLKILIFLTAIFMLFISMVQTVNRMRGTFNIATYLRTFIEPKSTELHWECRLQKLRNLPPKTGETLFGSLIGTYIGIALANLLLIMFYTFRTNNLPKGPEISIHFYFFSRSLSRHFLAEILFWIGLSTFILMIFYAWYKYVNTLTNNEAQMGARWKTIKEKESAGEGICS